MRHNRYEDCRQRQDDRHLEAHSYEPSYPTQSCGSNSHNKKSYDRQLVRPNKHPSSSSSFKVLEYNLSVEPTQLVAIMKGMGLTVKWPVKLDLDVKRVTSEWCEFHNNHGHNIADGIALRLEVVALLKRGHLKDLLTDKGKQTMNQRNNKEWSPTPKDPKPKGFCSIISRGLVISEVSYSSTKRHARANQYQKVSSTHPPKKTSSKQVIQFEDHDLVTLTSMHHDAVVISLQIANILIRRIFVDGGSSANILFLEAVKPMGLNEADINMCPTILVRFSSEQK
ncbi:uncharacterized protein LOC116124779 [Pistacia vera]|uniref:uncharacterized protein LOC116124779 n=1 Tax=Pistacia vera TaxID=55513 RepID=UPI0012639000|nr:uncharacterized protein LOC116124779 [Pistacia vera]